MAKRKSASYMTPGEQIAGTVFFVIYLVVLPLVVLIGGFVVWRKRRKL